MKTIKDLTENTLVTDGNEYARVRYCVHGNPYYAYVGTASDALQMDYTQAEIDNVIIVSDMGEDMVSECCG